MFPIDPNAPGGPDRSESLRHSYPDHALPSEPTARRQVRPLGPADRGRPGIRNDPGRRARPPRSSQRDRALTSS
jgi:hypothetical protein